MAGPANLIYGVSEKPPAFDRVRASRRGADAVLEFHFQH